MNKGIKYHTEPKCPTLPMTEAGLDSLACSTPEVELTQFPIKRDFFHPMGNNHISNLASRILKLDSVHQNKLMLLCGDKVCFLYMMSFVFVDRHSDSFQCEHSGKL